PHGGGGPGSGPVAVKKKLEPFLPTPVLVVLNNKFHWEWNRPDSIGNVHSFYGNFGIHVRALAYILSMGSEGMRGIAENSIINANYLRVMLADCYQIQQNVPCMHEVIISGSRQKARGIRTHDIAKRLLDYGVHPPTVYFPLIVPECMMIEPTESESRETLDDFVDIMKTIDKEVDEHPDELLSAPHLTPVRRLDEAAAARTLDIRYYK
ncbi:aminomethyl-transferring glycine dehydrogenase subunit GcvPB, partial [bacterium]|nr:aminomethyl-transferring glycine dehydrogenase subunit GcvPB [bacterium]